uniref:Uncharacterized protein n=1 Tax=viral metagenome TaxID=1070528 RepID=A0A6C0C2C9_9ZZZZ
MHIPYSLEAGGLGKTLPWGYVYENGAYPPNLQAYPPSAHHNGVPVERGLAFLAGPSEELRSRVRCIASSCARSHSQELQRNACQCSAWQFACTLSNEVSHEPMANLCRSLGSATSPCATVTPELLQATGATTALPVVNTCFPDPTVHAVPRSIEILQNLSR